MPSALRAACSASALRVNACDQRCRRSMIGCFECHAATWALVVAVLVDPNDVTTLARRAAARLLRADVDDEHPSLSALTDVSVHEIPSSSSPSSRARLTHLPAF